MSRAARRRRLAGAMVDRGLGALVIVGSGLLKHHGYLDWIVGAAPLTRPAWALLRPSGELSVLVVGEADAERVRAVAGDAATAIGGADEHALARAAAAQLTSLGLGGGRIGVVGRDTLMSAGALRELESGLPAATIEDARGVADELKAIKDPDELDELRAAAAIAAAAYERLAECAEPGAMATDLAAAAHGEARRRGARDALVFIGCGRFHGSAPEVLPLERGSLVTAYVEVLGPGGYWIEQIGMLALGELDAGGERLAAAVLAALEAGERDLRAGRPSSAPADAMQATAREAGLEVGRSHSLGHGVGAGDEDAPRIALDERRPLATGMVAVLHPNLVDDAAGRSATAGGTYLLGEGAPARLSGAAALRRISMS